jgi:glycosyltransferase involved in cell wall biosynthesis
MKNTSILTGIFMPIAYKYADIITAQTQQQFDLFYKKRTITPHAIIRNIFLKQQNILIEQNEKKTSLWVGRLDKIKNPELFLDLARMFPSEHFTMIAPYSINDIEYGKKIKNMALQITNLNFIDYVPNSQINKYYNSAKIYVMTSFSEGFSNTMGEAMMNNCSILSFNVNSDNIITDYNLGYYSNGNNQKFYQNFKDLIDNKEKTDKLGINAYNYIIEKHDETAIIENLNELLN